MKKNSARQYAVSLWLATRGLKGKDLDMAISNFASLLARERLLKKTNVIIDSFIRYAKEQDGVEDIELASAFSLNNKVIESVKKIFGDKVEIVSKVDPALIGGIIIRTRDKILDASIKTQLNKLKQSLV